LKLWTVLRGETIAKGEDSVYTARMRYTLLAGVSATALVLAAGPTVGHAQTLEEALVSTYLTNPELEGQRAALRATDELVPQALSDWRPALSVDSSAAYNNVDSTLEGGESSSGSFNSVDSALLVDQNVYTGGQISANRDRAESLVRLERARLHAIEQAVLLNAVTAYADLLTELAVLELSIQNENRLRRQLQATQDRFQVGEVTRTDVAQAEARVAGAVAERIAAEGAVRAAQATYRAVINQEPVNLAVPEPLGALPATEAEAQELAQSFNPNVVAAQFDLATSRADVRAAESALLPRVTLNGEYGYIKNPSLSLDDQTAARIGARLTIPIYQGGGEYAGVRQSKQTVRQRRDNLEFNYRAVREEVTAAWEALTTARTRIESVSEQVRANQIAVEGARQEALVGQRTVLDVLDQEQDLFQSEVELVRAQRDQIVASYRLKAAVGQLTAEGIQLTVEPYDEEKYYQQVRGKLFGLGGDIDDR